MASIRREARLNATPEKVWAAVRDVGAVHERLAPGFVVDSPQLTHHNASLQVLDDSDGRSRIVWTADLLPNEVAGYIQAMIEQGMGVMKRTLEK